MDQEVVYGKRQQDRVGLNPPSMHPSLIDICCMKSTYPDYSVRDGER